MAKETLLIGMGAPVHRSGDGELLIEMQSISGLKGWKRNFDRVVAFAIESDHPAPNGWVSAVRNGIVEPDFRIVTLPDTYRISLFSRALSQVHERLRNEMEKADFCVFSYGGWLGDPGEIAASIARKNGIRHAVWLDRVESQVIWSSVSTRAKWKTWLMAAWTALNERRAVRKATLALLHGHTVHQHFKTIAKNPHIAEDIHYSESDRLRDDALDAKIGSCRHDLLRIIYVGRAEPMKGGKLWIETLAQVKARGVGFEASWYGDGAQLTELKKSARALHLSTAELRFHGFVSDRDMVKAAYQKAHILLFCHLTDESPRNLIESLHAATPLVGFDDPFARNLVDEKGAGVLVERGDVPKLVDIVSAIAENRECLVDLVQRAAQSASHLTRDRVFDERSAIVKRELGVMPGRGV